MSIQQQALEFGLNLLKLSDQEILRRFRNCSVQYKSDGSELTEADQRAEQVIRTQIEKHYPSHGILGEESFEKVNPNSQYKWVIDPIDGSTPFSLGLPLFGTLIALLENNQPIMGIVHLPAMGETLYSAQGEGCWFKVGSETPQRVQVNSACKNLSTAFVSSAGVHNSDIQRTTGRSPINLTKIANSAKKFRFLGDCTQHSLICRGKIHVAIDSIMQPWDSAAVISCVREARGIASTTCGDQTNTVFGGSLVTSCCPELHQEVIAMLNRDET